jgi:alpha-glucosidase
MGSFSLKEQFRIGRALGMRCLLDRARFPLRQRFYEAGTCGMTFWRRRAPIRDIPLGDLLSHHVDGQVVDLVCTNGVLRLEVLAQDLVCFRLLAPGTGAGLSIEPLFSYALDPDAEWPPVAFDVTENEGNLTVCTKNLTCRVNRVPCRLSFYDDDGQPLSEAADGLGFRCQGVYATRRLVEAEAIYGLAEKAFALNLRGRCLEMWNTDPEAYSPGDDPINLNVPMLIGLRAGRAYGFFFDNPSRARFDLGQARPDRLRYEADSGELCVYFFAGPTIPAVLARYTQLTGRMPLPPRWLLGYHQSRWSYYPAQQIRELVAEFRRRRIPCDAIHLDIHYLDGYRIFTWDHERFPDLPGLLTDLRRKGVRAISIIDPGVKVDPGYHVHDKGLAGDVFCKLPDGRRFQGPVWPGECYFPDFTDPQVRAWWGDLYQPLLEAGVAGFWNDMNEPAIFGGEMATNVHHKYEGRGASHGEVHNVYGLQMARASAEGLRRLCPDERVPLISRAGYAGLQRQALVWTADNHSTWAQLRLATSMCLNLGLCGLALCGSDVGGFAGDCNGELLARWTQVGALTPFFRNHSALGTAPQEPWAFGEPYESICRRWIELRYELLPYIYTAAWQAARCGLPMMRPLALAFPTDFRTYNLDDQFLLGDALLAAPVGYPGQRSRRVYLPGGTWYDFWGAARLCGEVQADAPLERMPLYVRAGTVLPLAAVMQHSGEGPPEALKLHVYPGKGESWFYEDDGHSLAYQAGAFRLTHFVCEPATGDGGLAVHRQVQGPFDPGYARFDIHVHGLAGMPQQVRVDGVAMDAVDIVFDAGTGTARLAAGPWSQLEIEWLSQPGNSTSRSMP